MSKGLKLIKRLRSVRNASAKTASAYHKVTREGSPAQPRKKGSYFRRELAASYREDRKTKPGYKPKKGTKYLVG